MNFYDPGRLSQGLAAQIENTGKGWSSDPYLADVGMIVLPEITEANIREAVQKTLRCKMVLRGSGRSQSLLHDRL